MQSEGAIRLPSFKDNGSGCVFILKCIYTEEEERRKGMEERRLPLSFSKLVANAIPLAH